MAASHSPFLVSRAPVILYLLKRYFRTKGFNYEVCIPSATSTILCILIWRRTTLQSTCLSLSRQGITVGALLAGNQPPNLESVVIDIAALRTQQYQHLARLITLESNERQLHSTLAELHDAPLYIRWFCCRNKCKAS